MSPASTPAQILRDANPYPALIDDLRPPPVGAMCRASSLLQAFDGAVPFADPVAVATAAYAFFVHQTYLFELVGLPLLGEMTARLREPVTLVALAAQAIDEARHVEIYRQLAAQSSSADDQTAVPETMYQAFVGRGSIEEKAVKAFVLLESLAVGMFAARASFYGDCAVARIDRRILHEEAQHQSAGLAILSELVATNNQRLGEALERLAHAGHLRHTDAGWQRAAP